MSRRLKILLYGGFTVFAVLGSALLTFPYDVLGRRLETVAAQSMPGSTLVINRIGPALPLGLKLSDVTFTLPGKNGEAGASIQIDKLRLTPVWTRLLMLKPALAFSIATFGGEVSGELYMNKDTRHVEVTIPASKPMQLDDSGTLEKLSGVALQGAVSGTVSVNLDAKTGAITSGNIDGTIDGAHIKSGKVMGFPLPATDFGSPEFEMSIEKGQGKIEKLKLKSSDAEASVTGNVTFRADLAASQIQGSAKVKLTDAWFARNPTIKQFMSLAPGKQADGSLQLTLSGPLTHPVNLPGLGGMRF